MNRREPDDARQDPQFGYTAGGGRREPYFEDAQRSPAMSPRRKRRSLLPIFLTGAAVIVFTGFIVVAYHKHPDATGGEIPVIAADPAPVKVKPDNPGGMDIPFQDTTVYDELAQRKQKHPTTEVEHLLQPPEQPLPKPETPPVQPETATTEAPVTKDPAVPQQQTDNAPDTSTENPTALAPSISPKTQPPKPDAEVSGKLPLPAVEPQAKADDDESDDTEAAPPPPAVKKIVPAQPKPAAPKPASGGGTGNAVQLGAFRDEASATAEWKRLQSHHPDQLGMLSPTIERVDLGDKGIWYRLKAGPLGLDQAKQTCATLKASNVSCLVFNR